MFDLSDDLRPGKPELHLRLREGASALGLNAQMLANQLRAAYYGRKIREIQVGPEAYEIFFRLAEEDRNSLADLEYFYVTLADGTQVPIDSVAILEHYRGYARISRIDGQRTVTVQGNLDPAIAHAAELTRTFQQEQLPDLQKHYPGVRINIDGAFLFFPGRRIFCLCLFYLESSGNKTRPRAVRRRLTEGLRASGNDGPVLSALLSRQKATPGLRGADSQQAAFSRTSDFLACF